jgi:hypothetical protein
MYRKRIKLHAKFDENKEQNLKSKLLGEDARNTKPKFIKMQWKCIEKD